MARNYGINKAHVTFLHLFRSSLHMTGVDQPTIENSAAYINNWLTALKNDKTLLIKASSRAQKAADYILNVNELKE